MRRGGHRRHRGRKALGARKRVGHHGLHFHRGRRTKRSTGHGTGVRTGQSSILYIIAIPLIFLGTFMLVPGIILTTQDKM